MAPRSVDLTIAITALNESDIIIKNVEEIIAWTENLLGQFEVCVDDGSDDGMGNSNGSINGRNKAELFTTHKIVVADEVFEQP